MIDEISERAKEFQHLKDKRSKLKEELKEARTGTLGSDSAETEEKAKEFFSNASIDESSESFKELENLENELEEVNERIEDRREKFLNLASELKFPLKHKIENKEDYIEFPFKEKLDTALISTTRELLDGESSHENIEIKSEGIVVATDDEEKAMEEVMDWLDQLRETASHRIEKDEYVSKLRNRDNKIQNMLFVLYKTDKEGMKKSELEEATGAGKGNLRGVLYQVANNDPYLKKDGQKFKLTNLGKNVMEEYEKRYNSPEPLSGGDKDE